MPPVTDRQSGPAPRGPVPVFRSAIIKLTAVCDINCRYCYMFNQADRSHLDMPPRMPLDTMAATLRRVISHVPRDDPQGFSLVLHGGEPLLWPIESHLWLAGEVRALRERGWFIDLAVQTNLMHLPAPALLQAWRALGVRLGISLDGPRALNDQQRVDHLGRGTHDRVMANVQALVDGGWGDLIGGFLSVAQPDLPPAEWLEWLCGLPVPRADVLWPIGVDWAHPPWASGQRAAYEAEPRYGRWFAELFRLWWALDDPAVELRLFNNLVRLSLGDTQHGDMLVNDRLDMLVVNTSGRIEYPDYLRNARPDASATPWNVHRHGLDEVAALDPVFARLLSLGDELPASCRGCRHQRICGGGFLPGRVDADQILGHRESVLCADQMHFFDQTSALLQQALAARRQGHETASIQGE